MNIIFKLFEEAAGIVIEIVYYLLIVLAFFSFEVLPLFNIEFRIIMRRLDLASWVSFVVIIPFIVYAAQVGVLLLSPFPSFKPAFIRAIRALGIESRFDRRGLSLSLKRECLRGIIKAGAAVPSMKRIWYKLAY